MKSKELKRMMAMRMSKTGKKMDYRHRFERVKGYAPTKEHTHEYFEAKRDKKELPESPRQKVTRKMKAYKNLDMKTFLKKYPEWKV